MLPVIAFSLIQLSPYVKTKTVLQHHCDAAAELLPVNDDPTLDLELDVTRGGPGPARAHASKITYLM